MTKNILIIAGEPSGDIRAGELVKELKELLPDVSFWGIGGDLMQEQGVELIEHVSRFSIVGVWEAIKKLSLIRQQFQNVMNNIRTRKPAMAILIDYPGFNLKMAAFLHSENIPVIYYIIPQVWAWGSGRIRLLKQYVDKALVLFDFEEKLLKNSGVDCEFVGHPLLDSAPAQKEQGKQTGAFTIALLPGSRKSEILSMFPVMLDTAERIRQQRKDVSFVVAENSNIEKELYDSALSGHTSLNIQRVTDNTFGCLGQSDFAIVTSGTATLETAIMEKPMVISYRTSFMTTLFFHLFVRTPHIGLVNIVAGKEVVPEILQYDLSPESLSRKVLEIISNEDKMLGIKEELKKVKAALGRKGASNKAAEAVYDFIKKKCPEV